MIQDKVNQLLGIGALFTKGVKDIKVGETEDLARFTEGMQNRWDSDIKQLIESHKIINPDAGQFISGSVGDKNYPYTPPRTIVDAYRSQNALLSNMRKMSDRYDYTNGELNSEHQRFVQQNYSAERMRQITQQARQSMQSKGQASVMQEQEFKSLYNDLANEDTQNLSLNVANALKKGDRNG